MNNLLLFAVMFILGLHAGSLVGRLEVRNKPCEYFKTSNASMQYVPSRCVVK